MTPANARLRSMLAGSVLGMLIVVTGSLSGAAAQSAGVQVTRTDANQPFAYTPRQLQVAPGATVTWTNPRTHGLDGAAEDHPTNCRQGQSVGTCPWSSKPLPPGGSFSVDFPDEGTFAYFCAVHPYMEGTVVVGDGDPADAGPSPSPTPSPTASAVATPEPRPTPTPSPTPVASASAASEPTPSTEQSEPTPTSGSDPTDAPATEDADAPSPSPTAEPAAEPGDADGDDPFDADVETLDDGLETLDGGLDAAGRVMDGAEQGARGVVLGLAALLVLGVGGGVLAAWRRERR